MFSQVKFAFSPDRAGLKVVVVVVAAKGKKLKLNGGKLLFYQRGEMCLSKGKLCDRKVVGFYLLEVREIFLLKR